MKNLLLISIGSFLLCSCIINNKSNDNLAKDSIIQKDDSLIEKGYYMLDKNQCLHSKVCPILDSLYQVRYIDTCDVCKLTDVFYCHHCFNKEEVDKIEKKIKDYTKANEKKVTKTKPDSTNTPVKVDSTVLKASQEWINWVKQNENQN